MAIPDVSGLLHAAPIILNEMPQIITGLQIVFYIVLVLGFGSIIIKGYRGYMHPVVSFLARVGFGFVALVCALGIANIIPIFIENEFYVMIQQLLINPIVGIIVSTAVLTVSVYLISHNIFNVTGMKKEIEKLQVKLKHAEEVLAKGVKRVEPVRIVGVVVLVAFIIIALLNFQGFPSMSDKLFTFMGVTPEDIQELNQYIENIGGFNGGGTPEGCAPIINLIEPNLDAFTAGELPESTDQLIISMIENGAGINVFEMYHVTHDNTDYYLAIADDGNTVCSAKSNQFCSCLDLQSVM